jgi:vanillate/3-O-methylgallate O-demethylase
MDMSDELVRGFGAYLSQSVVAKEAHMKLAGSFEGTDISDYFMSPVELGWAGHIKFDHEFYGRAALEADVAAPRRKIVTVEFNSDDIVDVYASLFDQGQAYAFIDTPIKGFYMTLQNDKLLANGQLAGISTTPFYSYYYRRTIALAFVDVSLAEGSAVEVTWGDPGQRQKVLRATIKPAPYKPDKRRTPLASLPATCPGLEAQA